MTRITDLPSDSTINPGDALPLVDVSSNITKQVTIAQLSAEFSSLTGAATFTTAGTVKQTVYNVRDYGAVGDGVTDDGNAINAAIAAAGAHVVYFPGATYYSTKRHTPISGQTWRGDGIDVTTILGNRPSDYSIYYLGNSSTILTNFTLQDMTLNANGVTNASCMSLYYANNNLIQRVRFYNAPAGGWGAKFGVANGSTETFLNQNNKIIDCIFDTHGGTLEMFLLFNCQNTQVIRPRFLNNAGYALGLWQKCYGTRIAEATFLNNAGGQIYYSVTVEDTIISTPYFYNCGGAITGANTSDNGNFGLTQAQDLKIINPVIIGGSNSVQGTGIQLGSVNNVTVINPTIQGYQIGISFNTGNNSNTAAATNWSIIGGQIRDNNQSNNFPILHPGIRFSNIGGAMYGLIDGLQIYDDQGTATQNYPIVFDGSGGPYTWSNIVIRDNRLSAYSTGTSIGLNNSAVIDSTVIITGNQAYTGTNPAQTAVSVPSATTSSLGAIQLANDLGGTATSPTTPTAVHLTGIETISGVKNFTAVNTFTSNDTYFGAGAVGGAGGYVDVGSLGTNDAWIDTRSSATNANLQLRAKGTGVINANSQLVAPTLKLTTTPTSGYVLTSDASGNATWQAAPVVSVAGRTGAITLAESDITNLSTDLSAKAAKGANSDITSLSGLTTPLTLGQGGTGSATQNFVDLTTAQSIGGIKSHTNNIRLYNSSAIWMELNDTTTIQGYVGYSPTGNDFFSSGIANAVNIRANTGIHLGKGSGTPALTIDGNGNIGIGIIAPTASVHTRASTTSYASLRIPSGTAPTTPNAGDVWYPGGSFLSWNNGTASVNLVDDTTAQTIGGVKTFSSAPTISQLNDSNGNPYLKVSATASAIGGFQITNAASGGAIRLTNVNTGNSGTIFAGSGTGLITFRPATDSTTAWAVQSSTAAYALAVDTTNLRVGIGSGVNVPTAFAHVSASTTATASLRIPSGTAPTSPNSGDVWNDGTNAVVQGMGLKLNSVGSKVNVATGTNASVGTGTLTAGTVTISTTAVSAASLVFLTHTSTSANIGILSVGTITAGTSFVVNSSNAADATTFNWWIVN